MKKLLLLGLLILISSPSFADDDEQTTIAKLNARLNGLEEQNRNLNGKVEDLQHQLETPTAPAPYGVPVPGATPPGAAFQQLHPVAEQAAPQPLRPVAQVPPQPAFTPYQNPLQPQMPINIPPDNQQDLAPSSNVPNASFPHADEQVRTVPYTPPLQGQAVISPRLEQPGVVSADGSFVTKPNPYQTKVAPPLPALPVTTTADDESPLEDEFDKIFQNVSNEDYATAKPQLNSFIVKHPGTDLSGEAYYWLGEIASSQKNYNEAAINYLKGYKEAPKGSKAPENMLKLALVLKTLGKNAEACKYVSRFNTEFPDAHPDLKTRAKLAWNELGCK